MQVGRALVSKERWETLEGSFTLKSIPKQVVFFLEGPSPGVDLLIDSVEVSCNNDMNRHQQNVMYGVNIIENSTFNDGLKKWVPLGSCTLSIHTGSPRLLPPLASESLDDQQPLSGLYVRATNRSETWMGPSQTITDKLNLHLTYQVAAWVRVSSAVSGPQNINVAFNVDNSWVNGGQVEVEDNEWHEIAGSFRVEKQPSKVVIYLQGPSPGVDLMLAGLHVFLVDRKARFTHLKEQTDKVRKQDIILKFTESDAVSLPGSAVIIRQVENSFPFGSCMNRSNIDNEEFVDFFVKNFNWAVFGNELKWYHTESQQGKFNYHDADEMLEFCEKHGINVRGHCIFWEVEDTVQPWVRSLDRNNLMIAVQNRLKGLLSRYKGRFKHYDVNNEMLHGSFYQDRLGKDIRAFMFRESHQLDPTATLFVNDYNVEDGRDSKSTPEMYIQQILDLQERGAAVGGIGIQGHIDHPVGPIVGAALNKLAILGLPIWFTELDVAAENEHIRADDLEIILREAYAHPAVEGIVLWGFWELFMCRDHSHLVDAEGDVNEAGKRYLALKQEWLSHADGHIDAHGQYKFRGYQGKYTLEINTPAKKFSRSFVVDKGDDPLVLNINL
ncbi:Endo-1,4-beta-xylanase protein [Dioscorea alata]|uniref:Endo-1,4-beta-xylanase protein n=1 Tax=Dioscorea alata TaxID=55571 RepID=A0ACB7UW26_DIOAL|nr:Endo-1,4-beta-xylanase protein [Dioscorea alata]